MLQRVYSDGRREPVDNSPVIMNWEQDDQAPIPSGQQRGQVRIGSAGTGEQVTALTPGVARVVVYGSAIPLPNPYIDITIVASPVKPQDTLLEYLEHGPSCTGHESECPSLYRTLFKNLGVSAQDMSTNINSIIQSSICDVGTKECRAPVCSYEFTDVRVGSSVAIGLVGPLCGTDGCSSQEVLSGARDAIPRLYAPMEIQWKKGNVPVTSAFEADIPDHT